MGGDLCIHRCSVIRMVDMETSMGAYGVFTSRNPAASFGKSQSLFWRPASTRGGIDRRTCLRHAIKTANTS